jgi:hypothetical protein
MNKKGGNFFEEHIEKVVLVTVGLVCFWLLVTRVVFGPNKVLYGHEKLGPGEIDIRIREQAENLEYKLNREPEPRSPYDPCFPDFDAKFESAIANIDVDINWDLPSHFLRDVREDNREYHIPLIGKIGETSVEHIRTVAYVPTEEINKDDIYDKDNSEPNDIDFVTVESKIDVAQVAKNFYESFAGEDVPEEWRDPCLANPVFAAVQLQRQELLADGSWSDWQTVPRTKIDHRKKMFEVIERVEGLPPGGIKVRLLNFDNRQVMVDLLQPEAYRIASAEEEWFPPSLHKKYVKYRKEEEAQEKREAIEAEKKKREEERQKLREGRFGRRSETMLNPERISGRYDESRDSRGLFGSSGSIREMRTRGTRGDRERDFAGRRGWSSIDRRRPAFTTKKKSAGKSKKVSKTKSTSDFYDEYKKILIADETDIAKMHEPLVFWAHDDTVEPAKSYRYRVRLGVFNPIAGTDQVSKQDKLQKNNVILWSDFRETESVEVPARLYFFPRMIQEAKIVTVKVCRYVLGYWYSENFRVRCGEVIGKVIESEPVEEGEQEGEMADVTIPETIDYSTGAIYVDAIPVNNWVGGKNMHVRPYYDMLYSFDGTNIEHIPINQSYWAQELQIKFSEIEESEEKLKKPLRDWGSKTVHRKRAPELADERTGKTEEKRERDRGGRAAAEMEALRKMKEKRMKGGR